MLIGELMKVKLDNIAEIKTGYTFRNGLKKYQKGKLGVIQMKDLKDYKIDFKNIDFITDDSIRENHYLKKNDILFKTRGEINSTYIFGKDILAVASAPLIVLIVKAEDILPEYLNWYLNQKSAKEYYNIISKGTSQKLISINNLKEMEIEVPSKEIQKHIVELDSLLKKETETMETIIIKRKNVITQKLLNLIKGD